MSEQDAGASPEPEGMGDSLPGLEFLKAIGIRKLFMLDLSQPGEHRYRELELSKTVEDPTCRGLANPLQRLLSKDGEVS